MFWHDPQNVWEVGFCWWQPGKCLKLPWYELALRKSVIDKAVCVNFLMLQMLINLFPIARFIKFAAVNIDVFILKLWSLRGWRKLGRWAIKCEEFERFFKFLKTAVIAGNIF